MESLETLSQRAVALGVPASMVLKSALGRELLRAVARVEGLVLQGGGAVHHVYASARFSADLDFAQTAHMPVLELDRALETLRARVEESWGTAALTDSVSRGRLHRQKVRVPLRPGTTVVLALERYETPVHRPERRPLVGEQEGHLVCVEAPAEIIADKVVACIDRFQTRGTIKLRDLYDIDHLRRFGAPDTALVLQKLADYGLPADLEPLGELAATLDVFAEQELLGQLRGVLPAAELRDLDASALLTRVRALVLELLS